MKITVTLPDGNVISNQFVESTVSLGRSSKCDFVVPDESLSRHHCQIELKDNEFYITDLGSANGVYLDGDRIPPHQSTKVETFLQLSIGHLECRIEHSEKTFTFKMPSSQKLAPSPESEAPTKPLRKTNRDALIKSFSELKTKTDKNNDKKKKKKALPVIPFLAFLIVASGIIYQFIFSKTAEERPDQSPEASLQGNVPAQFLGVKDEFLTAAEYRDKENQKTCDFVEYCQDLKLNTLTAEGVTVEKDEIFVFFNPDEFKDDPRFERIKESADFNDVVGLYLVLKSKIFKDFIEDKAAQIHVILKDQDYKSYKVFRFHTKYFTGNEHYRMLSDFSLGLESKNFRKFWDYASPLIKAKDL